MRRLLPLRLRRMDEEQPHPARRVALERVRQARAREPAFPLGDTRRPGEAQRRPKRYAAENRRLFRRLHGRSRGREIERAAAEAASGADIRDEIEARSSRSARPAASRDRLERPLLRIQLEPGLCRFHQRDRVRRRGRSRPSGPRLLHEGRRQVEGAAHPLRGPRRAHVRASRRSARRGGTRSRQGHGDRDEARPRLAHPHPAPRSLPVVPQDGRQGSEGAYAGIRLGPLPENRRSPGIECVQRHRAGILQGAGQAMALNRPRRHQDLSALARRPRERAVPVFRIRERRL